MITRDSSLGVYKAIRAIDPTGASKCSTNKLAFNGRLVKINQNITYTTVSNTTTTTNTTSNTTSNTSANIYGPFTITL